MDNSFAGLLSLLLPLVLVVGLTMFIIRRNKPVRTMRCTRCDGSGRVDERWPDPSKPGGWHELHDVCPKCGGVGKV